jgi:signal transduction histidine kinase
MSVAMSATQRLRVLVVEDSPTQAVQLGELLLSNGYDVVTAGSGEAGLAALSDGHFDLVVSDVVMPGMSGYDLCRAARAGSPPLTRAPIVLLTSLTDPLEALSAIDCGADGFVRKPYEPEQLVRRLRSTLANDAQARDPRRLAPVQVHVCDRAFSVGRTDHRLVALLASTFEELMSANDALRATIAQLAEAKTRAERESAFKSRFVANVSHELRTPLNAIIGFSEALLEGDASAPLSGRQRDYLDCILSSGKHLLGLINELLDLSKVEAGHFEVRLEHVSLPDIIASARAVLGPMADRKGLAIAVELGSAPTMLPADPVRLKQVLYNLLSNAIKFTTPGGTITIGAREAGDWVQIFVEDTGIGIREEDMGRLFREFEQIHSQRGDKPEGSGLGLALTKHIVELHGGTIEAQSAVGVGTRLTINLPIRQALALHDATPEPSLSRSGIRGLP